MLLTLQRFTLRLMSQTFSKRLQCMLFDRILVDHQFAFGFSCIEFHLLLSSLLMEFLHNFMLKSAYSFWSSHNKHIIKPETAILYLFLDDSRFMDHFLNATIQIPSRKRRSIHSILFQSVLSHTKFFWSGRQNVLCLVASNRFTNQYFKSHRFKKIWKI